MESLGPIRLIALLLAVAIIAATCGFIASTGVLRKRRGARGFFVLGVFCGLTAGAVLNGTRRGLNTLRAVARRADLRPMRAGIRPGTVRFAADALSFAASLGRLGLSPPQWHRQMSQRFSLLGYAPSLLAARVRSVYGLIQRVGVETATSSVRRRGQRTCAAFLQEKELL